jgi:hypothetical protein
MLLVGQLPQKSSSGRDHVVLRAHCSLAPICALLHIRRIRRPDRGVWRQMGLHRHGIDRSRKSCRRQQRLQQARWIRGRTPETRPAQRLRNHFLYFRHGQRPVSPIARFRKFAPGPRACRFLHFSLLYPQRLFTNDSKPQATDSSEPLVRVHSV